MPFLLEDRDLTADLAVVRSALIVPCHFCPAASVAVRTRSPYLKLFNGFLRTPSYESSIRALRSRLEQQGVRTEVFDSKLPHHLVMCMWPAGRRKALARRAAGHDATIVLGCDAAAETARTCASGCRVILGMAVAGIMNVVPPVRSPFELHLEVQSVTRVLQPDGAGGVTRPKSEG